jgi:hypothetical protein
MKLQSMMEMQMEEGWGGEGRMRRRKRMRSESEDGGGRWREVIAGARDAKSAYRRRGLVTDVGVLIRPRRGRKGRKGRKDGRETLYRERGWEIPRLLSGCLGHGWYWRDCRMDELMLRLVPKRLSHAATAALHIAPHISRDL